MALQDPIPIIEHLIASGQVYEVEGYVVFDSISLNIKPFPPPIQYGILLEHVRLPTDYPLWAPYVDGKPSPWGNGNVTVNLHYLAKLDVIKLKNPE